VGSILPVLFGTILVCGGFASLVFFYYSSFFLPIDLIIVSAGIALTNVGSQNIVMQSTPRQSSGMSLAMTSLLKLIGSAIGPSLAAIFMQSYQITLFINNLKVQMSSGEAYNLIFFSCLLISILSTVLAIILKKSIKP